jgi:membrane protein required for colicin V production
MNTFDLIIAIVFFFYVALGVKRGFVREVFSLGTWIVAGGLAWTFADNVGRWYSASIKEPTLQLVAGFITLFVLTFVVGAVVTHLVHKVMLSRPWLKIPNLLLGGLTGGAKGGVIIMVAVLLIGLTGLPKQDWWRQSLFAPRLAALALKVAHYLPQDVAKHIRYT